MPRPPPPAAAFTSSGKPISSGVPLGRTGTPAARAVSFAASLSPPARSAAGGGPIHVEPRLDHRLGELGALREEAVAGMHGVGARLARGTHVLGRVEIRRDLDDRVRRLRVERAAVVGRRDGDRLEPLRAAGAEDAQRDLPAVGYEHSAHGDGVYAGAVTATSREALYLSPHEGESRRRRSPCLPSPPQAPRAPERR